MVWNPYNIAGALMVVVCGFCLLLRYVQYPRWEKRRIRQIEAFEREKDTMSRSALIRQILLRPLMVPVWLIFVFGVFEYRTLHSGDPKELGAFLRLIMLFSGLFWVFMLFPTIERVLGVVKGEFRLRRLIASSIEAERNAKGGIVHRYALGSHKGDRSYLSPVNLELGNWYFVAVVDGDAVAVLPVSRWKPDLDLRKHMPAEEANRS